MTALISANENCGFLLKMWEWRSWWTKFNGACMFRFRIELSVISNLIQGCNNRSHFASSFSGWEFARAVLFLPFWQTREMWKYSYLSSVVGDSPFVQIVDRSVGIIKSCWREFAYHLQFPRMVNFSHYDLRLCFSQTPKKIQCFILPRSNLDEVIHETLNWT